MALSRINRNFLSIVGRSCHLSYFDSVKLARSHLTNFHASTRAVLFVGRSLTATLCAAVAKVFEVLVAHSDSHHRRARTQIHIPAPAQPCRVEGDSLKSLLINAAARGTSAFSYSSDQAKFNPVYFVTLSLTH